MKQFYFVTGYTYVSYAMHRMFAVCHLTSNVIILQVVHVHSKQFVDMTAILNLFVEFAVFVAEYSRATFVKVASQQNGNDECKVHSIQSKLA